MSGDMLQAGFSTVLLLLVVEAVGEGEMLSLARMLAMEKDPLLLCSAGVWELLVLPSLETAAVFLPVVTCEVMIGVVT